jgi:hypothetical protein
MATVNMLALLNNDKPENEMARMTEVIKDAELEQGNVVTVIKLEDNPPPKTVLAEADTLIITGHSRFFNENLNATSLDQRRLGGYLLDDIVPLITQSITASKTRSVIVYCCETAINLRTQQWQNQGMELNSRVRKSTYQKWKAIVAAGNPNGEFWLSTIEYLIVKIVPELVKSHFYRGFDITGLNGVGHITEEDPVMRTFEQAQGLPLVKKLAQAKKELDMAVEKKRTNKIPGLRTKLQTANTNLDNAIQNKLTFNTIKYIVNAPADLES